MAPTLNGVTVELRRGLTKRTTPSGWSVLALDYYADPNKGPEYLREVRKGMDHRLFLREILRDWGSAAGNPFYPEYQLHGGDRTHVRRCTSLLGDQPILRGWDFGERHPACVWAQFDPTTRRFWVLRELMPASDMGAVAYGVHDANFNIRTFRDLVLWLSGELPYERTSEYVRDLIKRMEADDHYGKYPMPWFRSTGARPTRWLDFSGTEANAPLSGTAEESLEQTKADVLASSGIYLNQQYGAVAAGADTLRDLLAPGPDGWANLLIDPACPILRDGIRSQITYEIGTPQRPEREIPRKDGFYEHLHEALLYAVAQTVPIAQPGQFQRGAVLDAEGNWLNPPQASDLGFMETREPTVW